MKQYIATFYAQFGAIRFQRNLAKEDIRGELMPVPRDLSSSCGSCVGFETDEFRPEDSYDEIEQIVVITDGGYECIYCAADS